jgi:hypothetical protein
VQETAASEEVVLYHRPHQEQKQQGKENHEKALQKAQRRPFRRPWLGQLRLVALGCHGAFPFLPLSLLNRIPC